MTQIGKFVMMMGFVGAAVVAAPSVAHADECLEVGWRTQAGNWSYYRAYVDGEDGNHLSMHYDYKRGHLELKVFEKEKGDGRDVIVLRGRWYEEGRGGQSGKARFELEKGRHRAKGWYTYGDDDGAAKYDFVLRECKRGR